MKKKRKMKKKVEKKKVRAKKVKRLNKLKLLRVKKKLHPKRRSGLPKRRSLQPPLKTDISSTARTCATSSTMLSLTLSCVCSTSSPTSNGRILQSIITSWVLILMKMTPSN